MYCLSAAEHGASVKCGYIPSKTPLEKTKISFASSCQLKIIASELGMGVHIHIPFSAGLHLDCTCVGPIHALCVSHAIFRSPCFLVAGVSFQPDPATN